MWRSGGSGLRNNFEEVIRAWKCRGMRWTQCINTPSVDNVEN